MERLEGRRAGIPVIALLLSASAPQRVGGHVPRCGCVCKPEPCFWGNFSRLRILAALSYDHACHAPRRSSSTANQPAMIGLAQLLRLVLPSRYVCE